MEVEAEPRGAALFERGHELAAIEELIACASHGAGRLLVMEGPAGIGKTRLLQEGYRLAEKQGIRFLSARCSELERDFPFGAVRQLFDPLLRTSEGESQTDLFAGAAGQARPLFEDVGVGEVGRMEDPLYSVLYGLYWLTSHLCQRGPLLLGIDDVHWCDVGSLRFLAFLVRRLDDLPVSLLLAARRPEPTAERNLLPEILADSAVRRIAPALLTRAAVDAVLRDALGVTPDPAFTHACHHATGGNPFLLRELITALRAEAVEPTRSAVRRVEAIVPETIMRVTLLRLGRLPESAQALARAAAVLGDRVPARRAAGLAKLPRGVATEAADLLVEANILKPQRPLSFVHPLVRAAILDEVPVGRRAEAHREAADLLLGDGAAVDEVALHLILTEPDGDPLVVSALMEASRLALQRGAAETAVSFLRRALMEPPVQATRRLVLRELASAEIHAGELAAATTHLQEGVQLASGELRAEMTAELGAIMAMAGRFTEAIGAFDRAITLSQDQLPLEREARFYPMAAVGNRESRSWLRQRLQRVPDDLEGRTAGERRTLAMKAGLELESAARAASYAERAATAGGLPIEQLADVGISWYAVSGALRADRYELAQRVAAQAVEDARRRGSIAALAPALGTRAFALYAMGLLQEAEAEARTAMEMSRLYGRQLALAPGIAVLVGVLVDSDQLTEADAVLEETGFNEAVPGELYYQHVLVARGRLRLVQGRLEEALADLLKVSRVGGVAVPVLAARPWAVLALAHAGDEQKARELAQAELEAARAWGAAGPLGTALRACGQVETGERCIALLREATLVLERSPARLEYARALVELGSALRRANQRANAREALRQGLDIAQRCAAALVAERARQELRATGARPRRELLSGVEALTASEARIARMAAQGHTNREIAQSLFVTVKTVETHLSHVFSKLGVHSRDALRTALGS